jgi:hypothetical protein
MIESVMEQHQQELVAGEIKAPKHVMLTEGNLTLLRLIHTYRLLRISDLELLTGRTYSKLHRKLKARAENRYLIRIRRPLEKHIYYITQAGLAALLEAGLISEEAAERRVREGEIKSDEFLSHELMLSSFHIRLELATSHSPIRLTDWREGKEIHFSFPVTANGAQQEIRIEPDAFFTLQDARRPEGKQRRHFVLEADRSTMPKQQRPGSRRMGDKFQKYELSITPESHIFKKYDVKIIRVLTVTRTHARRDSLAATATELIAESNRRYFLFGSLEDLADDPASIFHPVFRQPGDAKPGRELMPPLAENQPNA